MIRNHAKFSQWLPALFDGQFHWDFISKSAFYDSKIEPMDIDACIERKGRVLMFETKDEGVPVQNGQALTLTRLWRMGVTIIHVEGKCPAKICGMAVYFEGEKDKTDQFSSRPLVPCNASDLAYRVYCWRCWAEKTKPLPRGEWEVAVWDADYADVPGGAR